MADLNRDRVLRTFTQHGSGLSRGEIARLLRVDEQLRFSDSTLQRLLRRLVEEGAIRSEGRTRGARYHLAADVVDASLAEEFSAVFSSSSLRLVAQLKRPTHLRRPVGYSAELLRSYVPNETAYLPLSHRRRLDQVGRKVRGQVQLPAGTYARKVLERLLIDFSFNSSRLEGNTYSLLDTEKLIGAGEAASGKTFEERAMILNHKEAIQYLVDEAEGALISPFRIRNLHYALTQDLLPNPTAPGSIRSIPVNIGQSVYTPSAVPQVLEECLDLICAKATQIDDPFEQALFLLAHISYLQAFEDGNKRTARLASNIPLVRDNLCPNSYADIPRDAYTLAILALYELNDLGPLAEAFSFAYQRSALRYDVVIQTTAAPDEFRLKYRLERKVALGEVVRRELGREEVDAFVRGWLLEQEIPRADRELLTLHISRDLDALNAGRLAGLNVTVDQFERWHLLYRQAGRD